MIGCSVMCLRRFSTATVYYRRIDLISWPFAQFYLHPPPGEWYNFLTSIWYDSINARVAIFETKYTRILGNLESECETALQQIDDRMYAKEYEDDYDQILCYGISFFKKRCMVKKK